MSPILVRPIREQFEHDRVIRVLQARYKRKFEVAINPGAEQNASVSVGELAMFPDLVLFSVDRGRKVVGTVEVETTESINTLEAMAEWLQFSRLRAAFYLYVPPNTVDTVKRLCTEHQVMVAEIWTYHTAVDQVRFTMVHRAPEAPRTKSRTAHVPEKRDKPDRSVKEGRSDQSEKKAAPNRAARAAKSVRPAKPAKPIKLAKSAKKTGSVKKPAKPVGTKKPASTPARTIRAAGTLAPKKAAKSGGVVGARSAQAARRR